MAELATEESRWAFDLDGYILWPKLLAPSTTAAELRDEGSVAFATLQAVIRGHAGGQAQLNHRAAYDGGPGLQPTHSIVHMLDCEPQWIEPSSNGQWVTDTSVNTQLRLGYDCLSRPDRACCWGVRVVCALQSEGTGVLITCPSSHKSNVHPPPPTERADELGATERVHLEPGDCVIAAATTLVAGAPESDVRLLELLFADTGRYPQLATTMPIVPEWHHELTPRQQALLAPTLGIDSRTGEVLADTQSTAPSLLTVNSSADSSVREEVWFWDLRGYLVLENAMDEEWVAECNSVLDSTFAQSQRRSVGLAPEHLDPACSPLIAPAAGTDCTEERISGSGGTWSLPSPYGDPFRKMIDYEPVMQRLDWMIDRGHVPTTCYTIVSRDGAAGQCLHGGFAYGWGPNYFFRDGKPRTEQVNIGWVLRDVSTAAGDGGLMILPGSHKSRLPLPRPKTTACDLPQVKHMQAKAGTVIMYTGTTIHGVRSWRNPLSERRFVNTKAGPNIRAPPPAPSRL